MLEAVLEVKDRGGEKGGSIENRYWTSRYIPDPVWSLMGRDGFLEMWRFSERWRCGGACGSTMIGLVSLGLEHQGTVRGALFANPSDLPLALSQPLSAMLRTLFGCSFVPAGYFTAVGPLLPPHKPTV